MRTLFHFYKYLSLYIPRRMNHYFLSKKSNTFFLQKTTDFVESRFRENCSYKPPRKTAYLYAFQTVCHSNVSVSFKCNCRSVLKDLLIALSVVESIHYALSTNFCSEAGVLFVRFKSVCKVLGVIEIFLVVPNTMSITLLEQ